MDDYQVMSTQSTRPCDRRTQHRGSAQQVAGLSETATTSKGTACPPPLRGRENAVADLLHLLRHETLQESDSERLPLDKFHIAVFRNETFGVVEVLNYLLSSRSKSDFTVNEAVAQLLSHIHLGNFCRYALLLMFFDAWGEIGSGWWLAGFE